MEITEKVAYLQGLMDGLGIDDTTKEGKVLGAIVDILDDMALSISDMESGITMVAQQVDILGDELSDVQDDLYDEEYDCSCGCCDDDDDLFDGELYEVTCPKCGDTVCIDEDMLDEGGIDCPGCGESLEFDLDGAIEEFEQSKE